MLTLTLIRTAMAVGAIVLVYRFAREESGHSSGRDAWPDYLLLNLTLVSAVLYFGIAMHPRPWVRVHHHDIFHYYLGSKYSAEVGYLDLYRCAAVADVDNRGSAATQPQIRRMDNYQFVRGHDVVADGDRYRALFTEERWEEFKSDVERFRIGLREEHYWRIVFSDNGYNATPVWNMVARVISNAVPVHWPPGLSILVSLDAVLLSLMFAAIWRAFGRRTSLLAVVFLGSLVLMADGTIRGAFLRMDWLACVVIATCALKRQRYKTAGALVAYAGMARIFPFVFAFGLGAKFVWEFVRRRRVSRRYVEFFVTLALVAVLLFALSLVIGGGLGNWHTFWNKIQFHDTQMSGLRVGFKPLLLAAASPFIEDWPDSPVARSARFDELKAVWWTLQAIVLGLCFVAARRREDYETLPLCYVLAFFLFAPTYYYHVVLLLLTLLYLPKLAERPRAHGVAYLFGISIVGYVLRILQNLDFEPAALEWRRIDHGIAKSFAVMLLVAALYALGFSLTRRGPTARTERSAQPVPRAARPRRNKTMLRK